MPAIRRRRIFASDATQLTPIDRFLNMDLPLLLLPGMACDHRMWQAQTGYFGRRALVGDITRSDTVSGTALDLLARAPRRFALAGLSMGGILAFEVWRRAPERVAGLALLDTNPNAESRERRLGREQNLQRLQVEGASALESILRDTLAPVYLAKSRASDQKLLDCIVDMGLQLGEESFVRQNLALRDRPDSLATLPDINVPCLVLCGVEDQLCPVSFHQLMADRIPGARLEVLDDCGHLSSMECPDEVNAALAAWLADCT